MEALESPPGLAGLTFNDDERQECRSSGGVLRATLEFGPACNLRCLYCYAFGRVHPQPPLTLHECYHVIEQVAEAGGRTIVVIGGGEPLLYSHWKNVVRFIRRLGLTPVLFTNGQLLDDGAVSLLANVQASVVLKMDSLEEGIQDSLAATPGAWKAMIAASERLLARGFAANGEHRLAAHTVICSQNVRTLPPLWRWTRAHDIIPLFQLATPLGRAADRSLGIGRQQAHATFTELLKIDEQEFGYTWSPQPPYVAGNCDKFLYNVYVSCSGVVWPCAGVDIPLGSTREQSLREILGSPEMVRIRNVMQHLHGTCSTCSNSGRCYGCRGAAYAATGDPFASDPECWRNSGQPVE